MVHRTDTVGGPVHHPTMQFLPHFYNDYLGVVGATNTPTHIENTRATPNTIQQLVPQLLRIQ
jgi:hypothetical protein